MIPVRYRQDYAGEFVVTNTKWYQGRKNQQTEWIPNPIDNQHISGLAAVIAPAAGTPVFDHARLQRHRGGLQGKRRLQTYGSAIVWRDMRLDFHVTTDQNIVKKIHEEKYNEKCTVYTSAKLCLRYPGEFYIVPYLPQLRDLALSIYLAAFDGHREIFLLNYGMDCITPGSKHEADVNQILETYKDHRFYLVGVESNMSTLWRNHANVTCMPVRQFVSYCDI